MLKTKLNDPRKFTANYPQSNILINQALQVIAGQISEQDLITSLDKLLLKEQDALINVAINLSPSVEVSQLIWHCLDNVINQPFEIEYQDTLTHIFAIPLVLVAGSKTKAKLKAGLNVEKLNDFFIDKEIFTMPDNSFISGKLIDPQAVSNIKPSQLYRWVKILRNANGWLPLDINGSAIEVHNEGVFLRFLIGVIINKVGESVAQINQAKFREYGVQLMQFCVEELKTEGVTLFPIPFQPVSLLNAFTFGDIQRKEVAIQVALSNIVRKIRESNLTPLAVLSTVAESINIHIKTKEMSTFEETSVWHLTKIDDFDTILSQLVGLLDEMRVEITYV